MEISLTTGCICHNLTIDGQSISKIDYHEILECIQKIINNIKNKDTLISEFIEFIFIAGDYDESTEDYYYKMDNYEVRSVVESDIPNPKNCDYDFTKTYHYREYLTINGEDLENLPIDKIRSYLINLITDSTYMRTDYLYQLVEDLGVAKFVSHCEECGDNVYTYTIKID